MNYDVPLNCCHITCPWIKWAALLMGLKVSSYLENFQPVIMKFFSLFSFHFLWDSIYMYFSIIYIYFTYILHIFSFKSLWWTIIFFPKSFHSDFPCLYLTHSIFFSFRNIRIIVLVSILMSFLANYAMYILTVFLLIDFSLIMDIFLLLCTLEFFYFKMYLFILIKRQLIYNIVIYLGQILSQFI